MYKIRIMRPAVVLVIVMLMVIGGGVAVASHQFGDVPDSNPFHDDIDFIADRAITLGCGGGNYCPDDFVTREQMAAFMKRATGVATPSVNTATGFIVTGDVQGQCAMEAWTPTYEQLVVFSGGVYAAGGADATQDTLSARVQYRANGGTWKDVTGAWYIYSSNSSTGTGYMASPVAGALALKPGVAYEFSLHTRSTGGLGGCQLIAVISNRMPGQSIGISDVVKGASASPDDLNG